MVELIRVDGWSAATVSAIAARADVGRTTFYEHFDDREHLLQVCVDDLVSSFLAPGDDHGVARMAEHVLEVGPEMHNFVQLPQFRRALARATADAFGSSQPEWAGVVLGGGLLALTEHLPEMQTPPTPAELTQLMRALTESTSNRRR